MKRLLFVSLFAITWALAALSPALAGDLVVTRYFSGVWDQTHEESQGIVLQVIDQEEDGNPKAVAYWFTYGDDMQSAWYVAIGHVEGDQVLMELYAAYDVDFMQPDSVEVNPVQSTGTLVLTFKNCNKGTAAYTLDADSGEFDISRLASLYNSRCSGGISDNTPADAKPLMLEVKLLPPGDSGEAEGKAKFWERSDRTDFQVSAEDLADGEYEIHVCGANEGLLTVSGGEGSAHFRSPEAEGKELLTFDPRDCLIEIIQSGAVHLTSGENVLAEKDKGKKDEDDEDEGTKVELDLESTGVIEGAEGEAEYEVESDESEFEVEIKGVPAGTYGLYVNSNHVGDIEVASDGEEGKIKFSNPQEEGTELLDFEVWGATVEVMSGADTILWVTFPAAP